MTLADKRTAIEALLCAAEPMDLGQWTDNTTLVYAMDAFHDNGDPRREAIFWPASKLRRKLQHDLELDYPTSAQEAAYRLIESSPTLRREWFGVP